MNKPDPCKEMIATLTAEFPDSEAPLLMRAALLLRAKQQKQCEEVLEAAAAAPSGASATALLTLAQLQLQAKDVRKAVSTLGRIGALQNTPGMVGTLVALHERTRPRSEGALGGGARGRRWRARAWRLPGALL